MNNKKTSTNTQALANKSFNYNWIIVAVLAFVLYANTLHHDFVLDDAIISFGNKFVTKGIAGLPDIFTHGYLFGFNGDNTQSYRPMVLAVTAIETNFFGKTPNVYHLFNVLWYVAACVLLYFFVKKITTNNYPSWFALFITLLFVAHPIHTEVVANIKSRDEILCFFFIIAALLSAIKFENTKKTTYLLANCALFLAAILSKEIGLSCLLLIPITLFLFTRASKNIFIKLIIANTLVIIVYFIIRNFAMDSITFDQNMDLINNSVSGAKTFNEKIATCLHILGKYLILLAFPINLSYDYSYNQIPIQQFTNMSVIISLLVYLGIIAAGFYTLTKKHLTSFAIFFYIGTILLVSNIITLIGATMAERFLFSPSLGFCILISFGIYYAHKNSYLTKKLVYACFALILLLYSYKTISRNADWKNNLTLFSSNINTVPNSARAQAHLGTAYRTLGETTTIPEQKSQHFQKALEYYQKAINIYPQFIEPIYNSGVTYYQLGNTEKALTWYNKVLSLNKNHIDAINNTAVIYYTNKQLDSAEVYFNRLLPLSKTPDAALVGIGAVNFSKGNLTQAKSYFEKALQINPNNKDAKSNLQKISQ